MTKTKKKKFSLLPEKRIVLTLLGTVGVVFVWRGIWNFLDSLSFLNDPNLSLGIAIVIIVVAVLYFKKINFW
jgi:hypothetical protein